MDRGRQQVRDRLRMVGDKWSLVVVSLLSEGPLRFTELMRVADGISHRRLVRDGLVSRAAYAEVPPRVEYTLTDPGHTLLEPITELAAWVERHQDEIDRHRAGYDSMRKGGDPGIEAGVAEAGLVDLEQRGHVSWLPTERDV